MRKCCYWRLYTHGVDITPRVCSYELVRQLQRKVEAAIGPLVESKLEERPLQEDGHSAVASITEEVLNSQE